MSRISFPVVLVARAGVPLLAADEKAQEATVIKAGAHRTFEWSRCWQGGQSHRSMWEDMSQHRGMGHMGPGHHGGHLEN